MKRLGPAALVVLLGLAAGGCAVPSWVPFIGQAKEEPPPAPPVPAPRVTERATEAAPEERKPAVTDEEVTDRIIAVVNNDAVTLAELQESIAVFRHENQRVTQTDEELSRQFLARLIDRRLQIQEAEREKIVVDDAEVDEELAEQMKKFKVKSQEEFAALLKSQGLALEAAKKAVRDGLKVQKVIRRKVTLRVSVTDLEVGQYLEENRQKLETGLSYHARHILIQPEAGASDAAWEAARIRADVLADQVRGGADFAELARQHSRDATARDGGDLGTLKRGELALDIETVILALTPGEISPPHRSSLGYHLFRLETKETLEGDGLTRARQQIREILYRQKYEVRFEAWLKEIKARAIIEVRM